jgi:hypothetical protein
MDHPLYLAAFHLLTTWISVWGLQVLLASTALTLLRLARLATPGS